jgi:hypothetical protein
VKNQTARELAADGKRREKQTKERAMKKGKGQAVRCAACPELIGSCASKIAKTDLLT